MDEDGDLERFDSEERGLLLDDLQVQRINGTVAGMNRVESSYLEDDSSKGVNVTTSRSNSGRLDIVTEQLRAHEWQCPSS